MKIQVHVGNHVIGLVELGNMKIILSESQLKNLLENQHPDFNFNMGDCDIYAVALHRLYEYPLYAIYGYFLEEPWGGKRELISEVYHIMVKLPNGKFKDSEGEYTLKELTPLLGLGEEIKKVKAVHIDETEALSTFSMEDQEERVQKVINWIRNKSN